MVTHRFLSCPAPSDYTATTDTFNFSGTQNRDCVDVPIISNNIVELPESFFGNLDTTAPRVTLAPDVTEITITDEERKSANYFEFYSRDTWDSLIKGGIFISGV
jgi:hypothetical protein